MKDILKTVQRTEETDKHPCAVCNHTEKEFKDLHAALTASAQRVERLKTMSTVEMMCENPNVDAHVREWEARCLEAEQRVEELERDSDCALQAKTALISALQVQLKHATAAVEEMRGALEDVDRKLLEALKGERNDPSFARPLQLSLGERQELYFACSAIIQAALAQHPAGGGK